LKVADCEFYAAWLRAAAAAEALWGQALEDEQFKEHVMLLWCTVYPNFEIGAFCQQRSDFAVKLSV
jgi:hypothetical protein